MNLKGGGLFLDGKSVGIYTLGCKVSQYESGAVAEKFAKRGFSVLPFSERCDVYVINTCTVTSESDRKCRQVIRRAIEKNPRAVVAVIGCYSQRDPLGVAKIPGVDIVFGTADKLGIVDKAIELLEEKTKGQIVKVGPLEGKGFEPMTVTLSERTRAYVKIEDGCQCKCSYCAIAAARGPVRSKPREDVIREVEGLYHRGVQEIVLTGIETGSYGADFEEQYGLSDLICELDARKSCKRIRLGSLAPELVGEGFAEKIKDTKILVPHFHISMQSGSDKILRLMRRRYSRATAVKNIKRLKEIFQGAEFTTDLMVGFPGESETDFLDTVSLVEEIGFLDAHVFAYSKREGTDAAKMANQVPEGVTKARSRRLIEAKNLSRDKRLSEAVSSGAPLKCILETFDGEGYISHSDEFFEVYTEAGADREGELVNVLPISHKDGIIFGKIIN
jgi:threonylcarbamoyladenosine tRNA methylthiotransferase MtaB